MAEKIRKDILDKLEQEWSATENGAASASRKPISPELLEQLFLGTESATDLVKKPQAQTNKRPPT